MRRSERVLVFTVRIPAIRLRIHPASSESHPFSLSLRFALLLGFALVSSLCPPISAAPDVLIYSDALSGDWQNWSWDTTVNYASPSPVHSGTSSMAVTYANPWGGLYLHSLTPLDGTGVSSLRFWAHGGSTGGQRINVMLYDGSLNGVGSGVLEILPAASWQVFDLPIASLGSPLTISGITWQEFNNSTPPTWYIDDIVLVASNLTPTPSPTPGPGPALTVNAATGQHPISPYIYGMNFADEGLAAELRLPVRRWGGNATTRYNWENDTSNHASDWFFENIPNDNPDPSALPKGSSSDRFVEQDRRTATKTILTVPLIGWTPKSRAFAAGFSVAKYGPQQSVDPWHPDCGNGIRPDGLPITTNDPRDTSTPTTPLFVQRWINHLVAQYGTAAQGGVAFYNLDNEPMLWNSTHRDVHPAPVGYDEIATRTWQYAAAVKAADPTASTLGPVLWGWTAYFYSALDAAPGGPWWNNPQDRNAHGGVPFIEWYLHQMRAYELAHGGRVLDYVDVHYYPQAPNVSLSPAGDPVTQAKRLRSTRSLWDPTYTDESWINDQVRLIPRMKEWVQSNYPGTKLAITEYNWGALDHINGALAQADVLGILGREGIDLAALWGPPASTDPGAFAFRIYRNYDGTGSAFGDVSVQATSADQATVAIYAARRTRDNALTLVVINKSTVDQDCSVTLAGFTPSSLASVYRYSAADLTAIAHLSSLPISDNSVGTTLPQSSITLLVIPQATDSIAHWIVY